MTEKDKTINRIVYSINSISLRNTIIENDLQQTDASETVFH